MTGEVWFRAKVVNSLAMQIFVIDDAMYGGEGGLPVVPTRSGIITVNPASTTSLANCSTVGVMPGIS